MKFYLMIALLICLSAVYVFAGDARDSLQTKNDSRETSLNEYLNLNAQRFNLEQNVRQQIQNETVASPEKKSPFKAALFSALVPGSGEFYAKSYWKAALFAAVEIAAWVGNITYNNRGDDKDAKMRAFGDEHWRERVYWSEVYKLAVESDYWNGEALETNNGVLTDAAFSANINALRDAESGMNYPGFTHNLPTTKTQQYYEMIYKYLDQFGSGWDDLPNDNWDYYLQGANRNSLTPNISYYRNLRNDSNDLYRTATTMATVALLNHLISAFDAAITAKKYNKNLSYSLYSGIKYYAGENVRTVGLSVAW